MLKHSTTFLRLLILSLIVSATSYSQTTVYVNPSTGSDSNPGTLSAPFQTIAKGIASIPGGGIVYLRGGTYSITGATRLTLNGIGTPASMYRLWAYPGEVPVIDFSAQNNFGNIYRGGIEVSGQYWHLKGIKEQNNLTREGCIVTGSHNIVENCSFRRNGLNDEGDGLMLYGRSDAPANAHDNLILNCDSYDNFSGTGNGGNSDGFGIVYNIGPGNVFRGCRAWNNSDDGFDCWGSISSVLFDSCYSFGNGLADGNGQGFKMGGSSTGTQSAAHIWRNCVSANNKTHGFDQNGNLAGQTLYNCTAYHNGGASYNLSTTPTSGSHIVENCVSYLGSMGNTIKSPNTQVTDSWQGFTVNSADFASLDSTGEAARPRNANGSLPSSNFLRLTATSDLLSAGTDVGIPFPGARPDVGAWGQINAPDPGPRPGIPVLLAPTYGAVINSLTYTIRWQKVVGAARYQVQVAESSTFQNMLVNDSTVTDTVRQVSSLAYASTYYVRLRAKGATSSWSSFSTTVQFATTAAPPVIINPRKGSKGNPMSFNSRWYRSTGATSYNLQISDNSGFQNPEVDDSTVTDTVRQVTLLKGLSQYYCRVRAKSSSAWSEYSTVADFTTEETNSVINDRSLPTSYALAQNYPNPFNPTTFIRFSLPVADHVRLMIFNALGQMIRDLINGEQAAGIHEIRVDGAGLASGVYYYRMQATGFTATKTFVLLK